MSKSNDFFFALQQLKEKKYINGTKGNEVRNAVKMSTNVSQERCFWCFFIRNRAARHKTHNSSSNSLLSFAKAKLIRKQFCAGRLIWTCFRVFQGLLSVTEELHSLSFEACFTVQGLTIDLEVRLSPASHGCWCGCCCSCCSQCVPILPDYFSTIGGHLQCVPAAWKLGVCRVVQPPD